MQGAKSRRYAHIVSHLRRRLVTREWKRGERLPDERSLCEEYGVSRTTIRRVLETLQEERLIRRMRGDGTYASPAQNLRVPAYVSGEDAGVGSVPLDSRAHWRPVEVTRTTPPVLVARRLGIALDDEVVKIVRVLRIQRRAVALDQSWLMPGDARELNGAEFHAEEFPAYDSFAPWRASSNVWTVCTQDIELGQSSEPVAFLLGIKAREPVFCETKTLERDCRVRAVIESFYVADRFRFETVVSLWDRTVRLSSIQYK